MQTFTDLVGAAVVPTHGFDATELTDLTPALDPATAVHDMAAQASEAILGAAVITRGRLHCFAFDCN